MSEKKLPVFDIIDIINNYGVNLNTATVYIAGEIDANINVNIRMRIDMIKEYNLHLEKPLTEINFILNSPGGDAVAIPSMIDLYESLLKEGIKVNVYTEGICYSAATFLMACATGKRQTSKRTRFLVHELQIRGAEGTYTQTKSFQKELNLLNGDMIEIYTMCTLKVQGTHDNGKNPSDKEYEKLYKAWEKRCTGETYLSAEEAKELGLIDEII